MSRRGFMALGAAAGAGAVLPAGAGAADEDSAAGAGRRHLVITRTTVIDPASGHRWQDASVLVRGGRVQDVGPSEHIGVPRGARVVDGRGRFVVPGLMDMHVHSLGIEAVDLPLYLANGVTTVREMNGGNPAPYGWRDRIARGELLGPRFVVASPLVDGVPSTLAGVAPVVLVETPQEARAAVHQVVEEGADLVKVYTRLTPQAFRAIAQETRRIGVHFAGHAIDAVPLVDASDAGQRSVEHTYGILYATSSQQDRIRRGVAGLDVTSGGFNSWADQSDALELLAARTYDPARAAWFFRRLRANRSRFVPTLSQHRVFDLPGSRRGQDRLQRYLPAAVRTGWAQALQSLYLEGRSRQEAREHQELFARRLQFVGAAHRAGVQVMAGTDTGTAYVYPGFALHEELALLARAGLTPLEALRAATSTPARYLGRQGELGTVRPGALADLVVLDADPLVDVRNTRHVGAVVVRGRLIDRRAREELLAGAAAAATTPTGAVRAACGCSVPVPA